MSLKNIGWWVVLVCSLLPLSLGIAGIKWYVWDTIIGLRDAADRSMVMWGIPLFIFSLGIFFIGIALMMWSIKKIRS